MLYRLLIIFAFCFSTHSLIAQDQSYINQKYIGVFLQYGISYYDLPEEDNYQPLLIGAIYHLPFYQTQNGFNIGADIMPHIGITPFNGKTYFEFGTNVQFNFNFQLAENHLFSMKVGAGPHFVNVDTERQAKGFIFSDNFAFSYRARLNDREQLGITTGFRHISNAGLQQPNLGIDNIMLGLEFARLLE